MVKISIPASSPPSSSQSAIPSKKIRVRGINGEAVPIQIKNLTEAEKDEMGRVLDRIDEDLERCNDIEWVDDKFRKTIRDASRGVAFVTTGAKSVGAYASLDPTIVFLNRKLLRTGIDFDELCVTVLHELLHMVGSHSADNNPSSTDEAKYDMLCYALLGLDIPGSHWGFTKYPDLFDELTGAGEDGNEQ